MGQPFSAPRPPTNSTHPVHIKIKHVPYMEFHDVLWYWMLLLAIALLIICALLAGLTLAVCGLNMTFLQLRSVTGTSKQRQQALVVAQLKHHHSWMLCSLIICSVACGEYLPFVIQGLWDKPQQWVPVVISTLSIAFFAEIAPQYWVPRRAIEWGYYCWPIIWGCMWITCILSWPIAKLLDHCSGRRKELSIFSNDELAGLIKYHERSEKHCGSLGQDTTRVMLGALSLDGHRIGANFSPFPETRFCGSNDKDSDLEKADLVIVHGMIVNWSVVKTVDIDEPVDKTFIKKVKSWSYSRIPVVGEAQVEQAEPGRKSSGHSSWDAKKVFGFIHVKNLIDVKISDTQDPKTRLLVRDLKLYPLPIVMDDMPAYSLLNMFHLGMSRMAVVIRAPPRRSIGEIVIPKKPTNSANFKTTCWTGTERTNTRFKSHLKRMSAQTDLAKDFLGGAHSHDENSKNHKNNVIGIRCPEPLGIITFEDIIDTILQKTSRDERDFYDRENAMPRTKGKKAGDCPTMSTVHEDAERSTSIPSFIDDTYLPFLKAKDRSTLRKRNPSNKDKIAAAMDGADECSSDTTNEIQAQKNLKDYARSSYTQNSRGGFHGSDGSSSSIRGNDMITPEELVALGNAPPSTPTNLNPPSKVVSFPSRKEASPFLPGDWNLFTRRYVSAMPNLPTVRRVTPFSRQNYSSFEEKPDGEDGRNELIMPISSMLTVPADQQFGANVSCMDITRGFDCSNIFDRSARVGGQDSGDTISLRSRYYGEPYDIDTLNSRVYNTSFVASTFSDIHNNPVQFPTSATQDTGNPQLTIGLQSTAEESQALEYDGFPIELLEQSKENHVLDFVSKTLPRTMGFTGGLDSANELDNGDSHVRESGFHDDRALLPSQRWALNGNAGGNLSGMRSTSFWF